MNHLFRNCLLGSALLAVLPAAGLRCEEPAPDEFVGLLDESRTYRRVNGEAITGREVADYIIEQQWESELAAFVERELTQMEMARLQVTISEQELEAEMKRLARDFAVRKNINPEQLTSEELGRKLGKSFTILRDQQRTQLGLKKVLILEKKLTEDANLDDAGVRSILSQRLERVIEEQKVVCDPAKLPPDVGVRIGERSYPRSAVRTFILERLGPLLRQDLTRALEALTFTRLARHALSAGGKDALTENDGLVHLSYQAALLEMEKGPDDRAAFIKQLREQKLGLQTFMRQPGFSFDASLTCLARAAIREAQIRAEFDAQPGKYQLREKRLAHLFLRVRDQEGHGYTPGWEVPDHPKIQAYVAEQREKCFAAVKVEIERLLLQARNDFAAAVREYSEDEETRRKDEPGLIGRLSERSAPPEPLDADVLKAALKLKPGQISNPLRSAYGWHLVKCLDDQATRYEEARHFVYLNLLKQKRHALFKEMREGAKIEDTF